MPKTKAQWDYKVRPSNIRFTRNGTSQSVNAAVRAWEGDKGEWSTAAAQAVQAIINGRAAEKRQQQESARAEIFQAAADLAQDHQGTLALAGLRACMSGPGDFRRLDPVYRERLLVVIRAALGDYSGTAKDAIQAALK